ncbi:hypothetical protein [Candidatus Entotheonella palauensis]|uniref:Uncharacterized protein n=1 Tax=Candidatus Entotheonella gemina TaxID=1429439 RepID=W4LAX1_9BACT|nr:hypothetical protein [Candidatus Entotheonella palauensis]ETW95147.1 MAG: hypothetical protein ETSY2_48590 [Candidatus Entotheonella gemina]
MMIKNDQELKATQERIAYFEGLVAQLRVTTSPAEFKLMASGYLVEIERMHAEVMAYLSRHGSDPEPAEIA